MRQVPEESFRVKVRALFAEHFGGAADHLEQAVDKGFVSAIAAAYPRLDEDRAFDLAFHLSDWREDAAFLLALSLVPEQFTPEEVEDGVTAFLVHAPNHVAAAAKLGGWPITDIFDLGVLDGDNESPEASA